MPNLIRITVFLTPEQLEELDRVRQEQGAEARSTFARRSIVRYLSDIRLKKQIDEQTLYHFDSG